MYIYQYLRHHPLPPKCHNFIFISAKTWYKKHTTNIFSDFFIYRVLVIGGMPKIIMVLCE